LRQRQLIGMTLIFILNWIVKTLCRYIVNKFILLSEKNIMLNIIIPTYLNVFITINIKFILL